MNNVKIISLKKFGDERGSLISVEENINIPFCLKRVYYIFDTIGSVKRGCHAHKKLEQVLICVKGKCSILVDDGQNKETIILDLPQKGLYIGPGIWREMYDFSNDCVLMVLASELYDENDYIRNYDKFIDTI